MLFRHQNSITVSRTPLKEPETALKSCMFVFYEIRHLTKREGFGFTSHTNSASVRGGGEIFLHCQKQRALENVTALKSESRTRFNFGLRYYPGLTVITMRWFVFQCREETMKG